MVRFGGAMDPHQAFLLERGLKTFALRMKHHNENGEKLARYLEGHPARLGSSFLWNRGS